MALTERNRDYEVLIRINEDGSVGSHYYSITEILDDNSNVVSAKVIGPTQLDQVDLEKLLGSVASTALAENAMLSQKNDDLLKQHEEFGDLLTKASAQYDADQAEIQRLTALVNAPPVESVEE